MLNITYKHLQDPVKLGWFSLAQWAQLVVCAALAYAVSRLLPLPSEWSLSLAITICGAPATAAMVAMQADFDVLAYSLAALRWYRSRAHYLPGADPHLEPAGYRVTLPQADSDQPVAVSAAPVLRTDALWD
jgi:hypothetical protein